MASKLLIAESPLQLLPTLAALVGVSEGLVLQQLHYESLRARDDGWVTRSQTEWHGETFWFWDSVKTIERAFKELRDRGLIATEIVATTRGRATRMRVDHEALDALLEAHEGSGQNVRTRSSRSVRTGPPVKSGPQDPLKAENNRSVAIAPDRESREQSNDQESGGIERLTELLAQRVRSNTTLPVVVDTHWHADCRRVLDGVDVTEQASAELQLERVIEWATSEQFWRTRITKMADVAKHAATLWQQAQPWRDPDADRDSGLAHLAVGRDQCVLGDAELAAEWAAIDAELRKSVDPGAYELWLEPLHVHSRDESGWTVGVSSDRARWVLDRFGRVLRTCAGGEAVRVDECSDRRDVAA